MITNMHFEIETTGAQQEMFDAVADMPKYDRWLPQSTAFTETTKVTPYPVQQGTTYLDYGSQGERPGVVYRYEAPEWLGFRHEMTIRRGPVKVLVQVDIVYHFSRVNGQTRVTRDLVMTTTAKGFSKLLVPFVNIAFRQENKRLMRALKTYGDRNSETA